MTFKKYSVILEFEASFASVKMKIIAFVLMSFLSIPSYANDQAYNPQEDIFIVIEKYIKTTMHTLKKADKMVWEKKFYDKCLEDASLLAPLKECKSYI